MSHSINVGRWALVLGLFSLHCSGAAFTSAPDGQGAANGGGSKQGPPLGLAGDGFGDAHNTPQGGGVGSGGDDGEPAPLGNAGDAGVVSSGGEAGSGSEPVIDEPITLDLTACGADAFGTGINIDQPSDYIKYHYQDNNVRHFNPLVGAMDFWYRPNYAHTDGLNHHLFGTANWQTAGGLRLRKAASDLENAFQVMIASSTFQVLEIKVPANEYEFSPGIWTRISLVWYLSPDFAQRYVRLFINGTEAGAVDAPVTFQMSPDPNGFFVLGVWDFNDPGHASGWLDDFKVFGRGP